MAWGKSKSFRAREELWERLAAAADALGVAPNRLAVSILTEGLKAIEGAAEEPEDESADLEDTPDIIVLRRGAPPIQTDKRRLELPEWLRLWRNREPEGQRRRQAREND